MNFQVVIERLPELATGLLHTLAICAVATCIATMLGCVLAALRMGRWAAARAAVEACTALCAGVPLLVFVYLLFYVAPFHGVTLEPAVAGVAALSVYYAPYICNVIVAALRNVPPGQLEAARAMGLPKLRSLCRITLPQAMPAMLPPLAGLLIGMTKDSALLALISVPEFMFAARHAISDSYAPLEIYTTVALVYWLLCAFYASAARMLEVRMQRHLGHAAYRKLS